MSATATILPASRGGDRSVWRRNPPVHWIPPLPAAPYAVCTHRKLRLIDASAYRRIVKTLTVHFFGFYIFRQRIGKLVVVPEAVLLLREFYTLFNEFLAIRVLRR